MAENNCPKCGAPIEAGATECKFCGEKIAAQQVVEQAAPQQFEPQTEVQQAAPQQFVPQQSYADGIDPSWPVKNKTVAGILGILLGGIGIHKFYMGKVGMGILYILFCWTGIPSIIGFIEGIVYLCTSDENFQMKHHVRLG